MFVVFPEIASLIICIVELSFYEIVPLNKEKCLQIFRSVIKTQLESQLVNYSCETIKLFFKNIPLVIVI